MLELLDNIRYLIVNYYPLLIHGVINTIILAVVGTSVGAVIGLLLAIMKTWKRHFNDNIALVILKKILNIIASIYVDVIRGTPMMVQAVVFYYGLSMGGVEMSPFVAGLIVVTFNTSAYICEIIISGINAINSGQEEAASSLGLFHFQTMVFVILPQVFKNSLPALMNEFIVNIKDTSVLSVIGVTELFYAAKGAASSSYMTFAAYILATIIYLILTKSMTILFKKIIDKTQKRKISVPQSQTVPEVI